MAAPRPSSRFIARLALGALCGALATRAPAQTPPAPRDRTGSTLPAPTTTVPREGCVTTECHPGVKSRAYVHGPLRVNACDACHRLTNPGTHAFEPTRERHDLCNLCHADEATTSARQHEPFAKGECLLCHDPHTSPEPRLLRGERYSDACTSCHADIAGKGQHAHTPAAMGACGACHRPHSSPLPALLNADGRDLCLKCHVRTGLEIESGPVVHAPALGDCRVCHASHSSDHAGVLVDTTTRLCTECHQDVAHTLATATTQHAAVTTNRACTNCHSPHASRYASLLKDTPTSLCFECHNQPIRMPDGSVLANMKKVIETGKSLHGAITQRGCVECHAIHGGDHRRLLVNEFPSELYYPFSESSYALCFSCHDRQLVLTSSTTSATGFRNGSLNLHFVHVNRDKKGRSCRVCHDSHASSRDSHIRDEVAFGAGGWKMPIKYESLPTGGKCGGACHAPMEYNRSNPVAYPPLPPGGAWKGEDMIPGSRAEPARQAPPAKDRTNEPK